MNTDRHGCFATKGHKCRGPLTRASVSGWLNVDSGDGVGGKEADCKVWVCQYVTQGWKGIGSLGSESAERFSGCCPKLFGCRRGRETTDEGRNSGVWRVWVAAEPHGGDRGNFRVSSVTEEPDQHGGGNVGEPGFIWQPSNHSYGEESKRILLILRGRDQWRQAVRAEEGQSSHRSDGGLRCVGLVNEVGEFRNGKGPICYDVPKSFCAGLGEQFAFTGYEWPCEFLEGRRYGLGNFNSGWRTLVANPLQQERKGIGPEMSQRFGGVLRVGVSLRCEQPEAQGATLVLWFSVVPRKGGEAQDCGDGSGADDPNLFPRPHKRSVP